MNPHPPALFVGDAPGLDFLNSIATPVDAAIDWIDDGEGYLSWLEQAHLASREVLQDMRTRALPGELDRVADQARDLREWFRGFVRLHKGSPLATESFAELSPLNRLLERDEMFGRIAAPSAGEGLFEFQRLRRWRNPDALLLPVAEALARLVCAENFAHVKACEGPACTLLFADHTRGHARHWCAMATCGNRAKQAAHRNRLKAGAYEFEGPEVGLPMPDQPSFPGFEPPSRSRPTDRLFLGVFLDRDAAERGVGLSRRLRKELGLRGRSLPPERLHITLHHIGDYAGLPPEVVAAIRDAAATVRMDPFEVEFDRVASFSGRPGNRPLVLRGGDGLAELMTFQRTVGAAITRTRVGRPVASQFTPHVTLLYDDMEVEERVVEPIRWTVSEFTLVHSLLGQTRHVPLARWPLGG